MDTIKKVDLNGTSYELEVEWENTNHPVLLEDIIEIEYGALVTLRDTSKLIPGQKYRIIDYVTTTIQENTQSAGHPFDVIVTALDTNKLSETASAIQSARDTDGYFSNSNLVAWKIWYCLDNDDSKFAWADTTNGKGVIYRMIDEYENDCPYDFKNIMFFWFEGDIYLYTFSPNIFEEEEGGGDVAPQSLRTASVADYSLEPASVTDGSSDPADMIYDYSLVPVISNSSYTCNNVIKPWAIVTGGDGDTGGGEAPASIEYSTRNSGNSNDYSGYMFYLNSIFLLGACTHNTFDNDCHENLLLSSNYNSFGSNCYYNTLKGDNNTFGDECYENRFDLSGYDGCNNNSFGNYCHNNSFGNYCISNSFGNYCYDNSFGNYCYDNSFGNNCRINSFSNNFNYNSFGNNCYDNSFGNSCEDNSFGDSCYSNSFGNMCSSNSFGDSCCSNSFGYTCCSNSFGNSCEDNSFGNSCEDNSFGNSCCSNSFGDSCYSNSFGDSCYSNSFGDSCCSNSFGNSCCSINFANITVGNNYSYYRNNHFGDGCHYIFLEGKETASSTAQVQNYRFAQGTSGTFRTYIHYFVIEGKRGRDYETFIGKDKSGVKKEIVIVEKLDKIISITWSDLMTLRDNSKLIPGQKYRIIDYVTTTIQENTQSAGHPFDVIVTALDTNKLSETASAIQSARDTDGYFSNSNLVAWKIWYCLNNDDSKFAWADTTNGKGVIYRMIDEYENDCPYDFKNIQFKHPKNTTTYPDYYYTFHFKNVEGSRDTSLNPGDPKVYNNTMGAYIGAYRQVLNENVFIGRDCRKNSFGNDCYHNSFGSGCYSNSFGNNCSSNHFGDSCYSNSFGNYCSSNSFGDSCSSNHFGNNCSSNHFGNYCSSNSFGNGCEDNSFGNGCEDNSFGNGCEDNSFGNYCSSNSFGNMCRYIDFAESQVPNATKYNYYRNNHFGDGCRSIVFTGVESAGENAQVQNYNFSQNINENNSSYTPSYITVAGERGRLYQTYIVKDTENTIKQITITGTSISIS